MAAASITYHFTPDDARAVKDNLRKIAAYCRERIVPMLAGAGSIEAAFRDSRDAAEHAFRVMHDGSIGYGRNGHWYWMHEKEPDGYGHDDLLSNWRYCMPLLRNWKKIRAVLESEAGNAAAEKEQLLGGFEI